MGELTAQVSWLCLRVGSRLALSLYSSNEPGELSQCLCHDESVINIDMSIIIISHHHHRYHQYAYKKEKVKAFPYSIPSVGPGADPGVQAVSPQVTISHPPGGRLPLLSARPAVTSPAAQHHRPLAGTKLYCLVTEAHRCKQLARGCYAALPRVGFEPATY